MADAKRAIAPRREIFGWAMFDFANQAYTLLIITVIFGDLFTQVIVGDRGDDFRLGNLLWSLALAISYALVVLTAPVLGAVMDFSGRRKLFLFTSYILTVATTCALYFAAPGWIVLAMVLLILSNFAYAVGESFIASFLPDLGPPRVLGRISGFGWSLGYVGGLVSAALALLFIGEVSAENFERARLVGPLAGLFFLAAGIPTFVWLLERGPKGVPQPGQTYLVAGLARLKTTLEKLGDFRDLAIFLVSIFFAMAGIYIVIAFAFIYGAQVIGWAPHVRTYMFVVVQITAALGALGFGFLQDRLGARPVYLATLSLWIVSILAIYGTPQLTLWIASAWDIDLEAQHVFLVVGCLAGASLGSSQSAGRALVAILSPRARAAEFFGFWGLASKLAAIFGILGLGLLQTRFGLHSSILFCAALFACAIVVCLFVSPSRGQAAARLHDERTVPR